MSYLRLFIHRSFIAFFLFAPILTLPATSLLAADVTVVWDANSESDLDGYIFYYGTSSGNYPNSTDVGKTTQHTVSSLTEGTTYYFAVKAYDFDNNQSDFSKELVHTIPGTNSAPNSPAQPTGPSSGFTQASLSFDTSGTDPDGDLLTYRFDWGDGNISGWGGAFSRTHSYSAPGIYCLKAQSKDTDGAKSAWSTCLDVSIVIQKHIISASAGSNGSITPSGAVEVDSGSPLSFTITPNQNYRVADVMVDGSSEGSITTYTFNNVDRDHTIAASFVKDNQAPVSQAGADQTVAVNDSVQLDGSGSSDADGDSVTYTWSFTARPSGSSAALSDTRAQRPTFVADAVGIYTLQLIVNDGTLDSPADTVNITARNTAPVSRAGANQTVRVNDTVQLDGTRFSDADGDKLTYLWSFAVRPSGSSAALSSTTVAKPTYVVDVAGTYRLRLVVNDGAVDSTPDTVIISTENSAPVAKAGADQTVLVSDAVQLDGSGSSDVDGDSLTYKWSLISRPDGSISSLSNVAAVKPVFDVDAAGTYTVQLIVNDGTVDSQPDTVTISTENSAPVARAGSDQAVMVNNAVQLDGSGSSDVDGDNLTFIWSLEFKPDGSTATLSDAQAVKPTFIVDLAGTYTVQLIVNDGKKASAPDTVTISTGNSVPVANAGADQAVLVNDTARLDGSSSSDADGDALSYNWSFTSRPSGSKAVLSDASIEKPTFLVDVIGSYTLQLIVHDGSVNSNPDTVTISTDNSAPVSDAGTDQVVRIDDTVQLDGDGSSDADGDTLTFSWSVISKPAGSKAWLSSSTAIKPTFSADASGTYSVQLIVYDGTDYSVPDTVTITTENAAPISDAGGDQSVDEGDSVTLSGLASMDPDGSIAGYSWRQTGGASAILSDSNGAETTFIAPAVAAESETLTFQLTVQDTDGLQDVDTCTITVNRLPTIDSDGDGVPDDRDAFPNDPDEKLDTDGDGQGNNADTDDDNDLIPDTWELEHGLDPLSNDAGDDPDGDEITNINEYNLRTPYLWEEKLTPSA